MKPFQGNLKLSRVVYSGILAVATVAGPLALAVDYLPNCPNVLPHTAQPAPVPSVDGASDVRGRVLVQGSLTGNTEGEQTGVFAFNHGDQVYVAATPVPISVPAGAPTPCPSPTWSPVFQARPVSADREVLFTVWGTPDAFNSTTFQTQAVQNGPMSTVSVSPTVPNPLPAGVSPATIPNGMVGGYIKLKIPASRARSEGLSYRTLKNGSIRFSASVQVTGAAATATRTMTGGTTFRPRLRFSTPTRSVEAGACSAPITVEAVDGNGSQVPVLTGSGNRIKLLLSGSPGNLFLKNNCLPVTSQMFIQHPIPAPPNNDRGPETIDDKFATFYFSSKTAGSYPITAIYEDVDGDPRQITRTSQVINVNAKPPVKLEITGPASVNEGACSAGVKVRLMDSLGNEAPLPGPEPLLLGLGGSSSTRFFTDENCSSPFNLRITPSTSSVTVYFREPVAQSLKLSASAPGMQGSSLNVRVLALGTMARPSSRAGAEELAKRLYDRLVGIPVALTDSNLAKMRDLILDGRILEAAAIATDQDGFYNITLKNMVTPLSNRLSNPLEPLNDFTATWIGTVRDNRDARELLTGKVVYAQNTLKTSSDQVCANSTIYKSNEHYELLGNGMANLRTILHPVPQCAYNTADFGIDKPVALKDHAGLLTTRTWGVNHLTAGTNRRAIEFAFDVFLCKKITDLSDSAMPDWHIRRDVDRAPGGDPKVFGASCRACHGGLDGLGGAYSFFDAYRNGDNMNDFRLFYIPSAGGYGESAVMAKMNQNGNVFPPGWITGDDTWINFFIENQNQALGWSPEIPLKGNGIQSVGQMLANSAAFPACMAKRVFKEVCKRDAKADEAALLSDLSQTFQLTGYNMRRLFEKAASLSVCLGNGE